PATAPNSTASAWASACRPSCASTWPATTPRRWPPSPPTSTTAPRWWPATPRPARWTTCCISWSGTSSTSRASCSTACSPRPAWPTSTPASCCAPSRATAACRCRRPPGVERTDHAAAAAVEHVGVDRRGGDVLVPEQLLDGADVVAVLEQVGGEGVAQRVRRDRLVDAGRAPRPADRAPDHSVVQVVAAHDAVARIPRAAQGGEHVLPAELA